jgi:acyl-CoA thioester hydrolase
MPHHLAIPTRWADNDVYGHVNNVEFYAFFDTVINAYLVDPGGLDIHAGDVIGLCVESHCRFDRPLAFPEVVDAGMRVAHLGRSSVRYEIALFGDATTSPPPRAGSCTCSWTARAGDRRRSRTACGPRCSG